MRPLTRPVILRAVKSGGTEPVLQGQFVGILDSQAALFGAIDKEQTAERPIRLPT
ncbi:Uncharacterised protein [Mycobacteroides abscessus subsp. abscessus]|nr:Uncharacterised protein [Mycobacteroides abscessus subsp. abscessus]